MQTRHGRRREKKSFLQRKIEKWVGRLCVRCCWWRPLCVVRGPGVRVELSCNAVGAGCSCAAGRCACCQHPRLGEHCGRSRLCVVVLPCMWCMASPACPNKYGQCHAHGLAVRPTSLHMLLLLPTLVRYVYQPVQGRYEKSSYIMYKVCDSWRVGPELATSLAAFHIRLERHATHV